MTNNQQTISKGCYIVLSAVGCAESKAPVSTVAEASAVWAAYRDTAACGYPIGASDLKRDSGNVRSADGKLVARVSYNGRVWDRGGVELQEE